MSTFVVRTRDVDGSSRRTYKTREAAVKRFEEMSGLTIAQALEEVLYDVAPSKRPAPEAVRSVRAVSAYGTVVVFLQEN